MIQGLDELIQASTVKLTVPNRGGWGTGFFVTPELILTCAHVVRASATKQVKIHWQGNAQIATAVVEKLLDHFDLALLRFTAPADADPPFVYLDRDFQPFDNFYIYGYPDNFPQGASVTVQCEGNAEDDNGGQLIKFKGGQIRPGLSGSPLLNERTGKICGIVKFTHDRRTNLGGGAIPTAVVFSQISELIVVQQTLYARDKRWAKLFKTDQERVHQHPFCKLPPRDYPKFIGRKSELNQLLRYISPEYRQHITVVDGLGGVGKTALVLEAAYLCLAAENHEPRPKTPSFDAIIFTSAKKTYLKPNGILKRPKREATLQDIFRIIALTLDDQAITQAAVEDQINLVYQSLGRQNTLLIVDNMETMEDKDKQEILAFLSDLPPKVQAIITTREQVVLYAALRLESLPEEDSLQLIQQQAKEKGLVFNIQQSKRLYHRFGGIPVALIYAIGQRASGYSPKRILNPSTRLPDDIALFCFESSLKPLKEQPAHKLLMSIAIFQDPPVWDAVANVAGLKADPMAVEKGLARLTQLSLIREQDSTYKMLSITRGYALAELAAHPVFEQEAHSRWVSWYLNFAQRYGGEDWQDWRIQYDHLKDEWENLAEVLYWLAAQERYADFKTLWQSVDQFIDLYGYWQTRLHWLERLVNESARHTDLSTYVEALSEQGWTLTLMGGRNLLEATKVLAKAWKLREYADFDVQACLAVHIAVFRMNNNQNKLALEWIERAESHLKQANLDDRFRCRYWIYISYYQAEVKYWGGNYEESKNIFQQVVDQGEKIGWQRFTNYAQNWLADISIIQGDLPEAAKLLKKGLFVAKQNKEKRRIAHYRASYSRLEKNRGNLQEAREHASKALRSFKNEGMARETAEMRDLLSSIK